MHRCPLLSFLRAFSLSSIFSPSSHFTSFQVLLNFLTSLPVLLSIDLSTPKVALVSALILYFDLERLRT